MKIKTPPQEFFGVNIVPIVDLMMTLIVFFMIATKFIDVERDVRIRPPLSRDARPITDIPSEIVVNVAGNGTFIIAGRERSIEEIDAILEAAVKKDADQSVIIRGDRQSILQHAVNILDLCERHSLKNTYLTTHKTEE